MKNSYDIKKLITGGILGLAMMGLTQSAKALLITPADYDFTVTQSGNADVADVVGNAALVELYKQNAGGTEEDSFAPYYATTFTTESAGDYVGGSIVWSGPSKITGSAIYVFIKDGSPRPQYIFDISGWNGTDTITFSDFYVGGGSISHVSIFAAPDDVSVTPHNNTIPDGGTTALLLGSVLSGIGLVARRLKK